MLTSSYIHIPGIGAAAEKKIWSDGIRTWDQFEEKHQSIRLSASKIRTILQGIEESRQRLDAFDHDYFASALPSKEHWRTYRHFRGNTLFLDIETTGLSTASSEITMIGTYGNGETRFFINGINLDDFPGVLEGYRSIVTFNGARFDLPFIRHHFPQIRLDQLHIDLMYPLRRIGYSGGLKHIESLMGMERSTETAGLTGFDAVRLWYRYKQGDENALDTLIMYNTEDIRNLEIIIEKVYPELMARAFI